MQRKFIIASSILITLTTALFLTLRPGHAQDAGAASTPAPSEIVDQMMALIGQNKVDEATNLMDGLKNLPDARNAARDKLIRLRDEQGSYHGFEIAATQRFTGQFQTVDVMSYYDVQPVLLRFHFYRPLTNGPWNVLGFQITTEVKEIVEILHDTPIDYSGNRRK